MNITPKLVYEASEMAKAAGRKTDALMLKGIVGTMQASNILNLSIGQFKIAYGVMGYHALISTLKLHEVA